LHQAEGCGGRSAPVQTFRKEDATKLYFFLKIISFRL